MKKRIKVISLSLIGVFILSNIIWFMMTWVRPDSKIRSDILELMPMDSSVEEVIKVIESNEKWYVLTQHYSTESNETRRISVIIRNYGHPLYHELFSVRVMLRFNEESKLMEVEVSQFLRI